MSDSTNDNASSEPSVKTYEPEVFTDEHRLEKIRQVLPDIEQIFQKEFEENHFPGLIYGIVVDGDLLTAQGFGFTDLAQKIPTTTKSLFRIASMTKSFTAMAIVKLRDDEKLRLDDPVDQYVPELKVTDLLTSDAPVITIRHLLTQDAGMPEDDPWADQQLAITDTDFLAMLSKGLSLSNPPGTIWEYTNLGYAMLGRIITVVSQLPYQEYISQEILRPLGMMDTFWEYDHAPADLLVRGYRWEGGQYSEEKLLHDGVYGAMGGLITSIEDYSKYIAYHLQAWPSRNEPEHGPLRRSSLREMHHPWNFIGLYNYKTRPGSVSSAYCYGLVWSKNSDGIISVTHTGGLPGFGSNWVMLPKYGIALMSFANSTYANLSPINTNAINQLVTLADLKPRQLPVSKILRERKEQLVTVLLHNQWDAQESHFSTIFAENFFLDQSLELRKTQTQEVFEQAGKVLITEELLPKNQLRGQFNIKGEHATIQVAFTLSPENPPLIQELKLSKIASDFL